VGGIVSVSKRCDDLGFVLRARGNGAKGRAMYGLMISGAHKMRAIRVGIKTKLAARVKFVPSRACVRRAESGNDPPIPQGIIELQAAL